MHQIFIIDDHPIVRSGIVRLLERTPGIEVCGEADGLCEAREFLERNQPDLILLDLLLENESGLDFLKELRANDPSVRVLILSMMEASVYARRVLKAGARGFVAKAQATKQLAQAIKEVLDGQIYLSPKVALQLATETHRSPNEKRGNSELASLTDRQLQIFHLIGQGLTQSQIAERLKIQPRTVESHKAHIRDRLNCQTMAELNARAVREAAGGG